MTDQAQKLRLMASNISDRVRGKINGEQKLTRVIAITSGKGGVGKTNFTVNFALAIKELGLNVVILDADMGLANVDLLLGVNAKFNLLHVMAGSKRLEEIIVTCEDGIMIIPGGSGVRELADLGSEQIMEFMEQVEYLEGKSDVLLIDTGAGISSSVIHFLLAADEIILLTTPEPTAIADAYGVVKTINSIMGKNKKCIKLVVNKADNKAEGELTSKKICRAADSFLEYKIELLGTIGYDKYVSMAVKEQMPFMKRYPKAKATSEITAMAERYFYPEKNIKKQSSGIKSFFNKVTSFINAN
ncbi:flagellar biosynthesis protein FlhG [Desulfitispora alkaliphila]|uniref:MinD/ParA family protein n=1 Tax=Desulfitispora alkaliphila TaxID=622674 RepID=UPI003D1E04CB